MPSIKNIIAQKDAKPRVYLAGPMVFLEDPEAKFVEMKKICEEHGLEGVSPTDNQAQFEGRTPGKQLVTDIVQADFELMDELDGAIFCLDPFRRSTEMDPGTAVEIGYMKGLGKPMSGWTQDKRSYLEKVTEFFKDIFDDVLTTTKPNDKGGTSGLTRDPDGMLVHSDGMVQNGMAQGGIELSGGQVFAKDDWREAFEGAVIDLAEQFKRQELSNETSNTR